MDLFPMMTKSDPFARLREFPFPALRQLPRIGDALAGYRRAVKHGAPK
jgi:hypothetical protein